MDVGKRAFYTLLLVSQLADQHPLFEILYSVNGRTEIKIVDNPVHKAGI